MYDYEYEFDVLLALRLLKLLHMINPEAMEEPLRMFPTLPPDELYLIVSPVLWGIFESMEYEREEEFEVEWMTISHPTIDRLYALGSMQKGKHSAISAAWKKKIQDAVEYFLVGPSNSVFDLRYRYPFGHVEIGIALSPEYFEGTLFANNLIDLLRYFGQDLKYLESKVSVTEQNSDGMEHEIKTEWKEAA